MAAFWWAIQKKEDRNTILFFDLQQYFPAVFSFVLGILRETEGF